MAGAAGALRPDACPRAAPSSPPTAAPAGRDGVTTTAPADCVNVACERPYRRAVKSARCIIPGRLLVLWRHALLPPTVAGRVFSERRGRSRSDRWCAFRAWRNYSRNCVFFEPGCRNAQRAAASADHPYNSNTRPAVQWGAGGAHSSLRAASIESGTLAPSPFSGGASPPGRPGGSCWRRSVRPARQEHPSPFIGLQSRVLPA